MKMVVIVGPTAVGKTSLSVDLAEVFAAEIVSADSRQIYRGMDIGTAKATSRERARIPHHLIDVVDPNQVLTLAEYQQLAYRAIDDILRRGRLPVLVGGTGQYVSALLEGWRIPEVAPRPDLRASLETQAAAEGSEALHRRLAALDPAASSRIDHRNVRRVIRALEVCLATGQRISELQRKEPPPFDVVRVGLTRPRPSLYERIDRRVDAMVVAGLVEEVKRLIDSGYGWDLPAMSGLGYRQIGQFLRGEVTLDEAVALIKKGTRRFVQQQYNWFRLDDPRIHWIDPAETGVQELFAYVRPAIAQSDPE